MDSEITKGLDQTYARPIQWKDWAEKGPLPYETPELEYIHNLHVPTLHQLLYRWAGFELDQQIQAMFLDPAMLMKRAKAQQIRKREIGVPDMSDPEDVKIELGWDIQIIKGQIEQLEREISEGSEVVVETSGDMVSGFTRHEMRRTISSRSLKDKRAELRDMMKFKHLLQGHASEIVEHRGDMSIIEIMKQYADKIDAGTPNGSSVYQVIENPSPELEAAEGDLLDDDESAGACIVN